MAAKTVETTASVSDFINQVLDERKRADCYKLIELMQAETGSQPKMWGPSIIGFGSYHYKYESGHEGDMPVIGFSPRAAALTLYLQQEFPGRQEALERLGKHTTSKACVYIKKLADVDMAVLRELVQASVVETNRIYGGQS
jgi:hypothetical protein